MREREKERGREREREREEEEQCKEAGGERLEARGSGVRGETET